jgi:hypothetical protein
MRDVIVCGQLYQMSALTYNPCCLDADHVVLSGGEVLDDLENQAPDYQLPDPTWFALSAVQSRYISELVQNPVLGVYKILRHTSSLALSSWSTHTTTPSRSLCKRSTLLFFAGSLLSLFLDSLLDCSLTTLFVEVFESSFEEKFFLLVWYISVDLGQRVVKCSNVMQTQSD